MYFNVLCVQYDTLVYTRIQTQIFSISSFTFVNNLNADVLDIKVTQLTLEVYFAE